MRERGLRLIETRALVSVCGTLLAIVVPAVIKNVAFSHFAEAVDGVNVLGRNALAYAQAHPQGPRFPKSVGVTPVVPARGKPAIDPPGTWDDATFRALDFAPLGDAELPHSYSFAFEAQAAPAAGGFAATAHGDLDGDGVTSTFELKGGIGANGEAALFPGMRVDSKLE